MLRRKLSAAEERLRALDAADAAASKPPAAAPAARPPSQPRGAPKAYKASPAGGAGAEDGAGRSARFWTKEEHRRFLEGLERFGAGDAHSIAWHVGTRSVTQVRTHAQKYFLKRGKPDPTAAAGSPTAGKTASAEELAAAEEDMKVEPAEPGP